MKDMYMNGKEVANASNEIEIIRDRIEVAGQYGLQLEIVWSAIRHTKDNPDASIDEIMEAACGEWDVI